MKILETAAKTSDIWTYCGMGYIVCGMSKTKPSSLNAGAQTVDRACALIKEVARAGARGARMLDLCNAMELSRPTVHRILLALSAAGFIRQNNETRRYCLGTGLFEIGLAAPSPVEAFPDVTKLIDELAHETQDTVYLMMRSHDEVVCAWRGEGAFPIKANIVSPGDRRPMAASAAGLCILAAIRPEDAELILERTRPDLPSHCRVSFDAVRAHIAHAQKTGYTFGENLVMEGVTGVGMVVPLRSVQPYLGISISAISSRITPQRMPALLSALKRTSLQIAGIVDHAGATTET
jgi:DNA-binding IclR family transcriptional regulator